MYPIPDDRIAAGNHTGRTRAALPVQFFPVFSDNPLYSAARAVTPPLPQDRIAAGNHAGRTRAALPVQFFPVFSTEHLWGRRYFRNTKKTARTRHTKAARWFQ